MQLRKLIVMGLLAVSPLAVAAEPLKQPRAALIMGNADYKDISTLDNPVNDARDMRDTLQSLGFDESNIVYVENAKNRAEMRAALDKFYDILVRQKGVGLFFYAGHGIQVDGRNYLIPTEAKLKSKSDAEEELLHVDSVLAKMEDSKNSLNIIILDACRNNPFRGVFGRNAGRGLASLNVDTNDSVIIFATAANQVAEDGKKGGNGTFTKHFKELIKEPGLTLERVLYPFLFL